jgi:anthranilate/para-aminobenzoate synthase component II
MIQSVEIQAQRPMEHLIVDNLSTDDTGSLITAYAARAPYPVIHMREGDKGIYDAMNQGAAKAQGDALYFLNDDDSLFRPNSLALLSAALKLAPDGVVLSNGPGDPATADRVVAVTREVLGAGIPLFGICFGNQILGRALGRSTYKMVFGHRGINVPVIDHATGRVAVTAQNHGFALEGEPGERFDTDFGPAVVSHTCANDGVVEGVKLVDGRAFSVQYHPEAAAGPHDANYLFDQFVDLMEGGRR